MFTQKRGAFLFFYAQELGVKVNCTGPNAESDIADQVNMLNNAIENKPDGIGLAACDQDAALDFLQKAMENEIPVVCFDSAVPNAPEGSVLSTVATDNYGAGETVEDVPTEGYWYNADNMEDDSIAPNLYD